MKLLMRINLPELFFKKHHDGMKKYLIRKSAQIDLQEEVEMPESRCLVNVFPFVCSCLGRLLAI